MSSMARPEHSFTTPEVICSRTVSIFRGDRNAKFNVTDPVLVAYDGHGCSGTSHKFQRYTGRCVERGTQNSVRFV